MKRAAAALVAALGVALAGCDKLSPIPASPFQGADVTGAALGGEMRLVDHAGRPRALADFRGRLVVVIFGYTNCPDVCPTSLAAAAEAMKLLGNDAQQVQVLFVTVDPKRDTVQLLAQYVPAFDARFIGLTGSPEAVDQVVRDFKMYASAREGKGGAYTVDHSGQMFVMDRTGKPRIMWPPGVTPQAMAADLRVLLRS